MKIWILFSFLFFSTQAFADEVLVDQLTLLGTPIENRATGEKIALACTEKNPDDQECTKYRFVLFKENEAHYTGPEMQVKKEEELDDSLKVTYKKMKKNMRKIRQSYAGGTITFLILEAGITTGAFLLVLACPGALEVIAITWMATWALGIDPSTRHRFDLFGGMMGGMSGEKFEITREANGWNWSQKSKKVRNRKFEQYLLSIRHL